MHATLLCLALVQPPGLRQPEVTHLAFSPDGKTLAAGYYRHAFNRPGTDWDAFAVKWDATTGKRQLLPDAIGPVAYSPDGKWFAHGRYERSKVAGFRQRPYVQLALWAPGEVKNARVITAPTDKGVDRKSDEGSVTAFAFHPGGKHLAVVTVDQVWWLPLDGEPRPVAALKSTRWQEAPRVAFPEDGKKLRVTGKFGEGRGKLTAVTWAVGAKGPPFAEVGREEVPEGKAEVTATSPDGLNTAVASGGTIRLTNARTGMVLRELKSGEGALPDRGP
jgi:WD40 repeat protein